MFLRWIVSNYLRQAAEQTVRETAGEMLTRGGRRPKSESASPDEPSGCDIAVLFALPIESGGLVDLVGDLRTARSGSFIEHSGLIAGKQVVIAETGVGQESAAQVAADVIDYHQPRWLISAGFAGGLRDDIRPGHLLMVEQAANTKGESLPVSLHCDREWLAAAKGVHAGKLITVDDILRTSADKRRVADEHGAIACDMETFAVADVCRQKQTQLVAIRIVTDAVDDTLPAEIDRLMRQQTLVGKLGAAAGAIMSRPSAAKDLWDLRGLALKASDKLAKFLASTVPQLPK